MAAKVKASAKRGSKVSVDDDEEKRRLAAQRASEREGDDTDDEERGDDEDETRDDNASGDDDGSDDEREACDDEADDERGDDEDEERDDDADDERSAPVKGKRKELTPAEVRRAAEAAVRADRIRGSKIREIGAQFGYPKLAEKHASGETSVRAFKDLVLERLAERQKKRGNTTLPAHGSPELDGGDSRRSPAQSRDYEKGAAEARALLGKK